MSLGVACAAPAVGAKADSDGDGRVPDHTASRACRQCKRSSPLDSAPQAEGRRKAVVLSRGVFSSVFIVPWAKQPFQGDPQPRQQLQSKKVVRKWRTPRD